jgi:hypothetical protein
MSNAYVDYDPTTGKIKKIVWKEIDRETLSISSQLAEDFMHGKEKFIDWRVDIIEGQPVLFKKTNQMPCKQFSQLINLEKDKTSELKYNTDIVEFSIKYAKDATVLYITLKNDPSWLIKTIPLDTLMRRDGKYFLPLSSANTYSYFLGSNS